MKDNRKLKKVSVLSPCYNCAKYLPIFFDSIISQHYDNLEFILVNDGSSDNTDEIVGQYIPIFKANNIDFKYIKKENGGQASAIATGIKEVTGDYLIWPDSDDFLLDGSIICRAEYLDNNPECAIVRSNGYLYNEEDLQNPVGTISKIKRTLYFEDFINFNVPWCPGCYMVNMHYFDIANPNRVIPINSCGQNIQMILPVVFRYQCDYIDKNLFGYVIHKDSHSHKLRTYDMQIKRNENLYACVKDTMELIPGNTDEYLFRSRVFFEQCKYETAWKYNNTPEMLKLEEELKKCGGYKIEYYVMKYLKYSKISNFVYKVISKIRRIIK